MVWTFLLRFVFSQGSVSRSPSSTPNISTPPDMGNLGPRPTDDGRSHYNKLFVWQRPDFPSSGNWLNQRQRDPMASINENVENETLRPTLERVGR